MTIKIGRFESDKIRSLSRSGDQVRITGLTVSSTLHPVRVQQFNGLFGNRDESVVPVTATDRPDIDGFYRPVSGTIDDVRGLTALRGRAEWSIVLQRVADGFANTRLERTSILALRTNAVLTGGVTPAGLTDVRLRDSVTYGARIGSGGNHYRTTDDGEITIQYDAVPFGPEVGDTIIAPSDYYRAAAKIERRFGGQWHPVAGRQIPEASAGAWRVSNGLVRFTPSETVVGRLKVEVFDSGKWRPMATELRYGVHFAGDFIVNEGSVGGFFAGYNDVSLQLEWITPHVIRNDRDTVIVGFRRQNGYTQTLTLNAGQMFAEFRSVTEDAWTDAIAAADGSWASQALPATPGVFDSSPGVESAVDDAYGNRLVLIHTDTVPVRYATTPSGLYIGAVSSAAAFGIGAVFGGSAALTRDTGENLARTHLATTSWWTRAASG